MNYESELHAFYNWLQWNQLGASEIALYLALLRVKMLSGCPEWFAAPNATLKLYSGLEKGAVNSARNKLSLKPFERIEFMKGNRGKAAKYRLIPFDEPISNPIATQPKPITDPTQTQPKPLEEEEDIRTGAREEGLRDDALARVLESFADNIRPYSPIVADDLAAYCAQHGHALVHFAIEEGARNGARSVSYIASILEDWKAAGVRNVQQARNHSAGRRKKPANPPPSRNDRPFFRGED